MPAVRLFVSDIDGCLAEPFVPFDLEAFRRLRRWAAEGTLDGLNPALTLCTGRPLGYAEAIAQALGLRLPFLFEAGAGMYHPVTGVRRWHPDFDAASARAVREIMDWLEVLAQGTSMAVDRGKYTQAGLIGAETDEIAAAIAPVTEFVSSRYPAFTVAFTSISVDIMHRDLTKKQGLFWLGETLGVTVEEMAFMGDTNGDLAALQAAGTSFAPANATPDVRKVVGTVTSGSIAAGVLQAYQACLDRNRSSP